MPSAVDFACSCCLTDPDHLVQILESSQTLLNVLKRETVNLSKKRAVP